MGIIDELRAANEGEIILPSGMSARVRLPRIRDCIISGGVPLGAVERLEHAVKDNGNAPSLTPKEMEAAARFNDELVSRTLIELAGEPVSLSHEDTGLLSDDDYNEVLAYATRAKALPKVEAQA